MVLPARPLICEIIDIEAGSDDFRIAQMLESDILVAPGAQLGGKTTAFAADAGDFYKWLKEQQPNLRILKHGEQSRVLLHSNDIWLPLVFLAHDIGLPFYLNLASNYVYDKIKGILPSRKPRISLSAVYWDGSTGTLKQFNFDGDEEAFTTAIKQFDANKFLK